MPISMRNQAQDRPWTFKEWVQGKPIGHPSHPMFVHFPIAYYLAVLAFDVMSRMEPNRGLILAGTYLLVGAALFTVILVITGLVDYLSMVRGSSKRKIATRHLIANVIAAGFFLTSLALRWSERTSAQADTVWIVLEAVGFAVVSVAQYFGGVLVYEKGMRVSTAGAREPDERPRAARA
jgi:uncharacterized membrane protein